MTDIAEIIKRARDLLPRTADSPWLAGDEGVHTPKEYIDCFSTSGHTTPNAEFIAFARNNMLRLCDEVENMTKERDALHASICVPALPHNYPAMSGSSNPPCTRCGKFRSEP